jgi:hypothetical protein
MGIKISQLPALAVGNIRANDTLPIVDSLTMPNPVRLPEVFEITYYKIL